MTDRSGGQMTGMRRLVFTSALFMLLGAGAGSVPAAAQDPAAAPASSAAPAATDQAYRLEPGDAIEIKFFYNPELNEQVQIRPDGRISMGLIGEVAVSGQSVGELTGKLESQYKSILKQTAVSVQVRTFANRRVFVGGDVTRPGVLALVGRETVLTAILTSGGLRPTARRGEVVLIRRGPDGKPERFLVSLKSNSGAAPQAATFELQPFDFIMVSESNISKADRVIDQYIKQLVPVLLTGGFTYLFNGALVP